MATLSSFQRKGATSVIVEDPDRGGAFTYRPSTANLRVDNGIVFPASDGGVWVRQVELYVRPEWWGAKQVSGFDNTNAIKAAINSVKSATKHTPNFAAGDEAVHGGGVILFKNGRYDITTGNIKLYPLLTLKSEGQTTFNVIASTPIQSVFCTDSTLTNETGLYDYNNLNLSNLTILCNKKVQIGIDLLKVVRAKHDLVKVYDALDTGVRYRQCQWIVSTACTYYGNGRYGALITKGEHNLPSCNLNFIGCFAENNAHTTEGAGFHVEYSGGIWFRGCTTQFNQQAIDNRSGRKNAGLKVFNSPGVAWHQGHTEQNYYHFYVKSTDQSLVNNLSIIDNSFITDHDYVRKFVVSEGNVYVQSGFCNQNNVVAELGNTYPYLIDRRTNSVATIALDNAARTPQRLQVAILKSSGIKPLTDYDGYGGLIGYERRLDDRGVTITGLVFDGPDTPVSERGTMPLRLGRFNFQLDDASYLRYKQGAFGDVNTEGDILEPAGRQRIKVLPVQPTTADIAPGTYRLIKVISDGSIKWYTNDDGVIKSGPAFS